MNVKTDGTLEFTEPLVFRSAMTLSVNTVQFMNTTASGTGTALLGTLNCPAGSLSAPYQWLRIITADGSVAYIPCWK